MVEGSAVDDEMRTFDDSWLRTFQQEHVVCFVSASNFPTVPGGERVQTKYYGLPLAPACCRERLRQSHKEVNAVCERPIGV